MALRLKKVCHKVPFCEKAPATKLQGIHSPIYPCTNDWCGTSPSKQKYSG